jgi:hypothetical protein
MRCLITSFFVACLYGFVMAPANAVTTELVTNGGFETGDLTGWTCTGAVRCNTDTFSPHTGTYSMVGFDNTGFATLMSQTIATTVGATYDFSFWSHLSIDLTAANILRYSLDGGAVITVANTLAYLQTTDSFVASGTTPVIQFFFETDEGTGLWLIDDVSLTLIPLPAALPMFLLALAGFGFVGRQRRHA